jgi:hypothetical protein
VAHSCTRTLLPLLLLLWRRFCWRLGQRTLHLLLLLLSRCYPCMTTIGSGRARPIDRNVLLLLLLLLLLPGGFLQGRWSTRRRPWRHAW